MTSWFSRGPSINTNNNTTSDLSERNSCWAAKRGTSEETKNKGPGACPHEGASRPSHLDRCKASHLENLSLKGEKDFDLWKSCNKNFAIFELHDVKDTAILINSGSYVDCR